MLVVCPRKEQHETEGKNERKEERVPGMHEGDHLGGSIFSRYK